MFRPDIIAVVVLLSTLLPTLGAQSSGAKDDFNFAAGLFDRGLHDRSAKAFEDFLKKWPDDQRSVRAHFFCAQSLVELKKGADAIPHFDVVARSDQSALAAEAEFRAGEVLVRLERAKEAIPYLSAAAQRKDATPAVSEAAEYFLGEAHAALGDKAKAKAGYRRAIERAPDGKYAPFAAIAIGYIELESKDPAAALESFSSATRAPGETGLEARVMSAECLLRLKKYAEAQRAFAALMREKLGSFEVDVRAGMVRASAAAGDIETAVAAVGEGGAEGSRTEMARASIEVAAKLHAAGRFAEGLALIDRVKATEKEAVDAAFWGAMLAVDGKVDEGSRERIGRVLAQKDVGAKKLFALADALSRAKRHDEALNVFAAAKKSKDIDPTTAAEIGYAEAFVEHELGHFDRAIKILVPLVDTQIPDDLVGDILFAIGENHFAAKRFQEAAAAYGRVIDGKSRTKNEESLYKIAWCHYQSKNYDLAVRALDRLLESGGKKFSGDGSYLLGKCHEAAGRPEAARAAFKKAAQAGNAADPELGAKARLGSAITARKEGDLDGALAEFVALAKSTDRDDIRADAMLGAADVLFEKKRFAEARKTWEEFIGRYPDHARSDEARLGRAWSIRETGDHAAAAGAAKEIADAARSKDSLGEALYLLALECATLESWDASAAAAKACRDGAPDHKRFDEALLLEGVAHARMARFAEAAPCLESAAKRTTDPLRKITASYELAVAKIAMNRGAEAEAIFEKIVADDPKSVYAADSNFRLGEAAYARKEWAKACERYTAASNSPGAEALADKIFYKTGWALREAGDAEKAAAVFSELSKRLPESPLAGEATYLSAEEYEKSGKPKDAAALFGKMAERYATHELAKDAALRRVLAAATAEEWDIVVREGPAAASREGSDPGRALLVRSAVGDAFYAKKNWNSAKAAYRAVTESGDGPTAARAQFMIASAERESGQIEQAIDAFLKGSILYAHVPWAPRCALAAADLFASRGQTDRARKILEELSRDFAGTDEAKLVPERLKALESKKEAK